MKNARNITVAVAMALVAVLAIVAVIIVVKETPKDIAPTIDGSVNVTTTWPDANQLKVEHVEIPVNLEAETRVLLVDASGSMNGTINAQTGYDTIVTFCDYIGQTEGYSQIAKNLLLALDMGVKELGIVSDLASYPVEDLNSFEGKFYEGRELYIFVHDNVKDRNLIKYQNLLSNSLDQKNSTLVFVFSDGSKDVIFDNYSAPEEKVVGTDVEVEPEKVNPDIKVEDNRSLEPGNYLAPSHVRDIKIIFIIIVAMLVEIILALLLHDEKKPDWVDKAIQTRNIALDGSASVSNIYAKMIKYLKAHKEEIHRIWRFAKTVEKLTLVEAANKRAEGATKGWECLKKMQDEGVTELTLMSDLEFGDEEKTELHFQKIVFILPKKYDFSVLEKLKGICEDYEVIAL